MESLKIYAIYDAKAQRYQQPFLALKDIFAQRAFHLKITDENAFMNKWPEDFSLYKIAEFNMETGKISINCILIIAGNQISKEDEK